MALVKKSIPRVTGVIPRCLKNPPRISPIPRVTGGVIPTAVKTLARRITNPRVTGVIPLLRRSLALFSAIPRVTGAIPLLESSLRAQPAIPRITGVIPSGKKK